MESTHSCGTDEWAALPTEDRTLPLALAYAASAARGEIGRDPRITSTTAAVMADWLIRHGWSPMADATAPACTGVDDLCGAPAGRPCEPGCPSLATDESEAGR